MQDAILPKPGNATVSNKIFIVADGVGGNNAGDVASKIVTETIGAELLNTITHSIVEATIKNAINKAIHNLLEYENQHPATKDMATTLAIAVVQPTNVLLCWCGDSRILHIRAGQLIYETADHSFVGYLLKIGAINEDSIKEHPQKHKILRYINATGKNAISELYTLTNILAGDWLMLCTDGVLENLDKQNIQRIFSNPIIDNTYLKSCFDDICKGKTNDNYAMYLLQFGKET